MNQELDEKEIEYGLNKLLESKNQNKIDMKILKGLVNGEEDDADEFFQIIKHISGNEDFI